MWHAGSPRDRHEQGSLPGHQRRPWRLAGRRRAVSDERRSTRSPRTPDVPPRVCWRASPAATGVRPSPPATTSGASWREPRQRADRVPGRHRREPAGGSGSSRPAGADEPDVVYAGTEPSALFRSDDGGVHYELVRPLWDHPHRPEWGAGFGGQAIHTVLPHPDDPGRVLVAMSTGGVYRTEDAGASWAAAQHRHPGATSCPTSCRSSASACTRSPATPVDPERLYAQNHHGVYRSDDDGRTWTSIADGLPSDFGFAMVAHPRRSGTIWNFPLEADIARFPPDRRCRVYRSGDAGDELGGAVAKGCRRGPSTRRCCATPCAPTTPTRPGSTSAPAPARSTPAATRARAGR